MINAGRLPTIIFLVLFFLVPLVYSASFSQSFYYPKFFLLVMTCSWGALLLPGKYQARFPPVHVTVFLGALILLSLFPGLYHGAARESIEFLVMLVAICLLVLVIINFDESERGIVVDGIIVVALLQAPVVFLQYFSINYFLPVTLQTAGHKVVGTLGNPEFLATWQGVAFLLLYHGKAVLVRLRRWWSPLLILLGVTILATGNKGTMLFILAYLLWPLRRYRVALLAGAGVVITAIFAYAPYSIFGRAFLWIVGATMFARNVLTGVGLRQFENSYMDTIHYLFGKFPHLALTFGGYSAAVKDDHQIILQFAAELGIGGLLLSLLFVVFLYHLGKREEEPNRGVLYFLLIKSLYTVLLGSISGALLVATMISLSLAKRGIVVQRRAWSSALALLSLPMLLVAGTGSLSDLQYQKGRLALFIDNREVAENRFRRALELNPENSDSYFGLAQIRYRQRRYEDMKEYLQKTLQYRRNKSTYKISAYMYFYSKTYDEAFRFYSYLNVVYPEHLTSIVKLASIYLRRGEFQLAQEYANQALELKPRRKNASDDENRRLARKILLLTAEYQQKGRVRDEKKL